MDTNLIGISPIIQEALDRFQHCADRYSSANKRFLEDLKFAEADSDNRYQWPNEMLSTRDINEKPALTINKVRQHNLKIINDAKQNKPGVIVKPVGGGATYDAAQVWMGLIRHIEYQSNATAAYDTATEFQVKAGKGFWRVLTRYVDENSFDQEILIAPINDPLSCMLDPDAVEADKSDAKYGFVFRDVPRDVFEYEHPRAPDSALSPALGNAGWITADIVRVCEYYRVVPKRDKLYLWNNNIVKASELRAAGQDALIAELNKDKSVKSREVISQAIEWTLIGGDRAIESRPWPGKYIPLVQLTGEETIIEGNYDCKGHTRAMKDPQRMYNWMSSSAVEYIALQDKTPYIAAAESIDPYINLWNNANKNNYSVLPYRAFHPDQPDKQLPPPARPQPPVMADAYIKGMQVALSEVMAASGQYESQMGEQGNERTGRAIRAKQRQGDNATYHFINQLGIAIRYTGKILLDLIPKIYDQKRVLSILAVDGTTQEITLDPGAKRANEVSVAEMTQGAKQIFNPNVGKYWVEADIGPGYATKREQAFDALVLLLTQSKELVPLIGDLMLRAGDFPFANEAAERLRRMVPPQALGTGPSQQEQQQKEQIDQLKALLSDALDEIAQQKLLLKGKDSKRDIDEFKAQTDRMVGLGKLGIGKDQLLVTLFQAVQDALNNSFPAIEESGGQPSDSNAEAARRITESSPLSPTNVLVANGALQ